MSKVLILGGAGFIGSNLAESLCLDHEVTVVDGLLNQTGGAAAHLEDLTNRIKFIPSRIEQVPNLTTLLADHSIVVDSMAWTSHLSAMEHPSYDLELNQTSHLFFIEALKSVPGKKIIYLGSRSQYGNLDSSEITEETKQEPVDIQGTHKTATESYYRILSKSRSLDTLSLRIPNTFGSNQPTKGPDIGLVGSMIRDALNGKEIEIFGTDRYRHLLYVGELCKIIQAFLARDWKGFEPFNVAGHRMRINDLAELIVELAGSGRCSVREMPEKVRAVDAGSALFSDGKLRKVLNTVTETPIRDSLAETIRYFRGKL